MVSFVSRYKTSSALASQSKHHGGLRELLLLEVPEPDSFLVPARRWWAVSSL